MAESERGFLLPHGVIRHGAFDSISCAADGEEYGEERAARHLRRETLASRILAMFLEEVEVTAREKTTKGATS